MIDVEVSVFNKVATELHDRFPGVVVKGELDTSPARFPTVTITEMDNSIYQKMRTTNIENHISLMYEVNVYSNKQSGKKRECKEILSVADKQFLSLGFTRTMSGPLDNLADATVYRMVARYTAIVDRGYTVYQN